MLLKTLVILKSLLGTLVNVTSFLQNLINVNILLESDKPEYSLTGPGKREYLL